MVDWIEFASILDPGGCAGQNSPNRGILPCDDQMSVTGQGELFVQIRIDLLGS